MVLTSRKNAWEKISISLRYYANCVFTTLTVLILHNVEIVYFFYSNPVYIYIYIYIYIYMRETSKAWYAMLCYVMLCYAMLCYAVLCYAMLCYAELQIADNRLRLCTQE